jgi:hypothetical protein
LLTASEDALLKAPGSKGDDTFSAPLVAPHARARYDMIGERPADNNNWGSTPWRPNDSPALQPGGADRLVAALLATNSITIWPPRSVLAAAQHPPFSRNNICGGRSQEIRWRHVQQTTAAQANDLRIMCPRHVMRWGCAA